MAQKKNTNNMKDKKGTKKSPCCNSKLVNCIALRMYWTCCGKCGKDTSKPKRINYGKTS